MIEKSFSQSRNYRTLLDIYCGLYPSFYAVFVSHAELDTLVGRLMQMCDLIGDVDQRDALKRTIKQISRDWLDDLYEESGYGKFEGAL